jgi:hypothetical protein
MGIICASASLLPLIAASQLYMSLSTSTSAESRSDRLPANPAPSGVEHAGVIDKMVHDAVRDEVVLTMVERRPWDGSEERLFQLQEKINAYLSFVLDGEMADAFPALRDKPLRLRLECVGRPDDGVIGFLQTVHDQIAMQGIAFEAVVKGGGCGEGCGCATG